MSLEDEIKEIRNDVEHIKQDIDSINRVQVLASSVPIMRDIKNAVGKSKQMVACLFLTDEWISSADLARSLRIEQANLDKVTNRLLDRGLLYRERRGKNVYYKRANRLDLLGFDSQDEFVVLFNQWKHSTGQES